MRGPLNRGHLNICAVKENSDIGLEGPVQHKGTALREPQSTILLLLLLLLFLLLLLSLLLLTVYIHEYTCVYVYQQIYVYIYIYMYTYTHMLCVYTYIYIYIYIYIYSRRIQEKRHIDPRNVGPIFKLRIYNFGAWVKQILTQRRWAFLAHRLIS